MLADMCALHNWLLKIDGLSGEWENGVKVSDLGEELGAMDFDGVGEEIPNASQLTIITVSIGSCNA